MLNFTFLKKEVMEYIKTPKGIILFFLFIFFALSSPLLAKYMNEILFSVAGDLGLTLPDPTKLDSWLQFYKNFNTICLIVFLIIVTGTVSQEKNRSTIILSLTKNISRFNFLFSKFIAAFAVYTVVYFSSVLVSAWYTNVLFTEFAYDGLWLSVIMLWLMGLFFTSLGLFVSVISKTPTSSALFGFFAFAVLQILNISTDMAMVNPAGASTLVNGIIANSVDVSQMWINILSTMVASIILFITSYLIFRKQEI
jgi:ABC-2 type transport system permease protein